MRTMKTARMVGFLVAVLVLVGGAAQGMYTWTDEYGNYNATDRVEKLPPHYLSILRSDVDHFTSPDGYGFEKDDQGNINFFDHTSPGKKRTHRNPPVVSDGTPPGGEVTMDQYNDIKRRYLQSGKDPLPEMMDGKVVRIISADTLELEDGQKVSFIGIEFPEELKGNTKIHEEVMDYERKIIQGKRIKMLFGPQRVDAKGRTLAFVFVGTDLFFNADLVMNGYARVATVPPNVEYQSLFTRLQDFAQKSKLGIWDTGSGGVDLGSPAPAPTAPPQ